MISHQNTAINEELRAKLGLDGETARLHGEYVGLVKDNEAKVKAFVQAVAQRVQRLGGTKVGGLVHQSEQRKLDVDGVYFREKSSLYDTWVSVVRKAIEDRELIYRSIYKLGNNPRTLETFLTKKTTEIESDNKRERNHYLRRIEMLENDLRKLEAEIAEVDARQQEYEGQWVQEEHNQKIAWEAKSREAMNEKGYDLVIKYFTQYGKDDQTCMKLAKELATLAKYRREYKEKVEEARIIADPVKLREEIIRMEEKLKHRN